MGKYPSKERTWCGEGIVRNSLWLEREDIQGTLKREYIESTVPLSRCTVILESWDPFNSSLCNAAFIQFSKAFKIHLRGDQGKNSCCGGDYISKVTCVLWFRGILPPTNRVASGFGLPSIKGDSLMVSAELLWRW